MYNGLIGGIGEGLQAFNQAYQQALNYQLEKQKAANLADYQSQLGMAASQNSKTERAKGAAEAGKLGQPGVDIYNQALNQDQQSPGQPGSLAQESQTPAQPGQGMLNPPAANQGLMGPPAPQQAQNGPPSVFQGVLPGKGQPLKSQVQMQHEYELAQKGIDPQTGQPANNPLGEAYKREQALKQQELVNATSGGKSAQENVQKDFNSHPSVTIARNTKPFMDQMLQARQDPSPQGQESLVLNAFKIKFPTAPDVNSLDKLATAESAPVQLKSAVSKYLSGKMSQQEVDDLVRDAISTYEPNAKGFMAAQDLYRKKAVSQYGLDGKTAGFIVDDPGVLDTYHRALAVKKELGPYKSPSQQGGFLSPVYGLMEKVTGGAQSSSNASDRQQNSIQEQAQAELARRKAAKK